MMNYREREYRREIKKLVRSCRPMAITLFIFFLSVQNVYADCFSPAGTTGEIVYNANSNVPQICTAGAGWVALGILNAGAGSGGCSSPTGAEGEVLYNANASKPQYCDGANWIEMAGTVNVRSCSGPPDCPDIGDDCTDTTIFAGCHPVTYHQMFLHPNNQSAASAWSSESVDTGADDDQNGKVNQDWIVANKTMTTYPAFKLCDDLSIANALGHNDWYLPSRTELYYMWSVQAAINAAAGDNFLGAQYWMSTEVSGGAGAPYVHFTYGLLDDMPKTTTYDVRCMRRN